MKRFVKPGEEVGIEEEFSAGQGTYVENGVVFASIPGQASDEGKTLSVTNKVALKTLKLGDIVFGRVQEVIEPIALIEVLGIEDGSQRFMKTSDYVVLHASKVKQGYVKNIHAEIKVGDIILARIDELRGDEFKISTVDPSLGVIKAFCTVCRRPLALKNFNLVCENCGHREYRKASNKYRSVNMR